MRLYVLFECHMNSRVRIEPLTFIPQEMTVRFSKQHFHMLRILHSRVSCSNTGTGGASGIIRSGRCALTGGISIMQLRYCHYVDMDGNIYRQTTRKNTGIPSCKIIEGILGKARASVRICLKGGDTRNFARGRVVLSAFYPKVFPNQTVEHLDGDIENNRPENLVNCKKWINIAHAHSRANHVALVHLIVAVVVRLPLELVLLQVVLVVVSVSQLQVVMRARVAESS